MRKFLFVGLLIAFVTVFSLYTANRFTAPMQEASTQIPNDFASHSLHFPSKNGAQLAAWFVRGTPGRGVFLLLRGYPGQLSAMFERARFLNKHGYGVLVVDLQGQGLSGGDQITYGYREQGDVLASLDKLSELAPGERVGALGISVGAAALVLADVHDKLAVLILESMYSSIDNAVDDRMAMHLGPIAPIFSKLLLWQIEPRLGVSTEALRPIDRLHLVQEPVLLVHGMDDRHTLFNEAKAVFRGLPGPKMFYPVPDAGYEDLYEHNRAMYEAKLATFLDYHMEGNSTLSRYSYLHAQR